MKISRALVQRNLISYSCSWTCFPGRFPRTVGAQRRDNEWSAPALRPRSRGWPLPSRLRQNHSARRIRAPLARAGSARVPGASGIPRCHCPLAAVPPRVTDPSSPPRRAIRCGWVSGGGGVEVGERSGGREWDGGVSEVGDGVGFDTESSETGRGPQHARETTYLLGGDQLRNRGQCPVLPSSSSSQSVGVVGLGERGEEGRGARERTWRRREWAGRGGQSNARPVQQS